MIKRISLFIAIAGLTFLLSYAGENHKARHAQFTTSKAEEIIAITILAEARGEGEAGMYAVAAVIAQRANDNKITPEQVCMKRKQFSCWNNKTVKDLKHLLKVDQAKYALLLARNIKLLSREFVGFANHYHNKSVKPSWAKGKRPVKIIGNHIFYKL